MEKRFEREIYPDLRHVVFVFYEIIYNNLFLYKRHYHVANNSDINDLSIY